MERHSKARRKQKPGKTRGQKRSASTEKGAAAKALC